MIARLQLGDSLFLLLKGGRDETDVNLFVNGCSNRQFNKFYLVLRVLTVMLG